MSQKVVEFYIQTLKEYTTKLNKEKTDKITVLMQVGEFFEIYGLIYPNGSRVGNVWEFCDDTNLKVAKKTQVVYDNPDIKVYMGGVGESYINPYIQKAVEQFGWTIVIFDQHRIGNSDKFERREQTIISPGVNINADTFSNITLFIYMEQIKSYINTNSIKNKIIKNDTLINIGMAYVDCLTGENGVMAINNSPSSDISIPLDELLKILTIKNPKELVIHLEGIDTVHISDEDLTNALHLFNYNYKIIRNQVDEQFHKLRFQTSILDSVYVKHRGIMDILQQLDLDSAEHNYSRIALTLLLEFILKHDKTIIQKLETPEIMINSNNYLMLANNCLEQLDIINNTGNTISKSNSYIPNKRITLLEMLDNTKTPLGKMLLRRRLSIPITNIDIIEKRYNQIDELYKLHSNYITTAQDKFGSVLYQLRQHLSGIKNIDNYLRKIITLKIQPFEISSYLESLTACITTINFINDIPTRYNISTANGDKCKYLMELLPNDKEKYTFQNIKLKIQNEFILDNLEFNVWNGVISNPFKKGISVVLDTLQNEIDSDQHFLDNLLIKLSQIIDNKYDSNKDKPLIYTGENATKGIYIFTNTARKDILEAYFSSKTTNTNTTANTNTNANTNTTTNTNKSLKVGNYMITGKDIKFLKMKESKWEIEIPQLKISNGSLKANIDRMGKLAKMEVAKWLQTHIINDIDVLRSLSTIANFIGEIDVLQSNTLNAIEKGYTRPIISGGNIPTTEQTPINNNNSNNNVNNNVNSYLKARAIRHPIIEYISRNTKYVPNDVALGVNGMDGMLLFGVNAVGKSSLMKSVGVNIIMAQSGMFVASSYFEYKPFKYLFTRILGNDNLYAGLSSFEVEMKEFKVILKYADENSILLCDELFRGTQVNDAEALVASGLEILSKRNVKFVSATHLHSLTTMPCIQQLENIKSYHLLVEQDSNNPRKLIYSRKLKEGSGPASYGILVADAMNIDNEFVSRAKEIRLDIENNNGYRNNIETPGKGLTTHLKIGSKYNKEKVIGACEVCSKIPAIDVHHINMQCSANNVELIENSECGIFNKNKLWNLVALCKECHQSVHSSPVKLTIDGYIHTSNGLELKYNWCNNISGDNNVLNNISKISNDNSNIGIASNNKIINTGKFNTGKQEKNNNKLTNDITNTIMNSITNEIPDEIKNKINDMKFNNATPKKIQTDIKRLFNINITQQFIRNF